MPPLLSARLVALEALTGLARLAFSTRQNGQKKPNSCDLLERVYMLQETLWDENCEHPFRSFGDFGEIGEFSPPGENRQHVEGEGEESQSAEGLLQG